MSLFSFFRKNKQEPTSDSGEFYSRAEDSGGKMPARAKRKPGSLNADPVDHAVPEKKRARRRLVGAVALVLAAIIGLPMVLDSEQKPLSNDIAIQIPSKDVPVAPAPAPASGGSSAADVSSSVNSSETASLDAKEEIVEPAAQAAPQLQEKNEKTSIPIKGLVANVDSEAVKTDDSGKFENPAKTQPHEKPPAKERLKTELKPAVAPKAEPKVEHKAETKADPKVEHKAEPKALKKIDEAARARAILDGDVPAPEKQPSKFVIQVAALATQDKVNDLQSKLKEAGIKSYTQKIATASGERIRIRVGPFGSKEDADKVRAKLGKLGLNGTLVPV